MTSLDALLELLDKVGATRGKAVLSSDEDLLELPQVALKAMKTQRLLVKASPAKSAVCPGCEEECIMPVYIQRDGKGASAAFVVCDRRDDTNRVPIQNSRLTQWQCNADLLSSFIATSLRLRSAGKKGYVKKIDGGGERREIGIVSGKKRAQMLCLETAGELSLVVGKGKVSLAECIGFCDGSHTYTLDAELIKRLADAATTGDERYTPSNARREANKLDTQARYESWQKAYRELKKKHPDMSDVWYSQQIAKNKEIAQRRDAGTIRKHMKK